MCVKPVHIGAAAPLILWWEGTLETQLELMAVPSGARIPSDPVPTTMLATGKKSKLPILTVTNRHLAARPRFWPVCVFVGAWRFALAP